MADWSFNCLLCIEAVVVVVVVAVVVVVIVVVVVVAVVVVAVSLLRSPGPSDGVDLVDEDDAWALGLGGLEQLPHSLRTHAHKL